MEEDNEGKLEEKSECDYEEFDTNYLSSAYQALVKTLEFFQSPEFKNSISSNPDQPPAVTYFQSVQNQAPDILK